MRAGRGVSECVGDGAAGLVFPCICVLNFENQYRSCGNLKDTATLKKGRETVIRLDSLRGEETERRLPTFLPSVTKNLQLIRSFLCVWVLCDAPPLIKEIQVDSILGEERECRLPTFFYSRVTKTS